MFIRDADDKLQRQQFTRRGLLVGAAQVGLLGALAARLYQLQVLDNVHYVPLAEDNRINVQLIAPMRGRIFDRFGEVLAANREGYRAVLVPALAGNVRLVLDRLARIVPIELEERERLVQRGRRQAGNVPLVVATELGWEQLAAINVHAPSLPGVQIELAGRRRYFHGSTVGHVVGYVGGVERTALDDDPVLRLPGMRQGRAGVERGLEDMLRGQRGMLRHEVNARGDIVRHLDQQEPRRGQDVVLTIDTGLQSRVLTRLQSEKRAAAVVMDVVDGEVILMASVPTHDPAALIDDASGQTLRRMRLTQHNPMLNRAIRGLYPPGSTFKMVTALAGLEAGVIDLTQRLPCTGQLEYGGQAFRCWKRSGHGTCDLHRALRESCDCYFYETARRLGIDALAAAARQLGFGQLYDCGIALQKAGVVPDPDWKRARLGKPWLGGETLLAGIGQGFVLTTPLQLAVMTARIASGRAVVPTLVRSPKPAAVQPPPLAFAPRWLTAVRRAMDAVVNEEGGTGAKARLEERSVTLAGKTGTSQVGRMSSEQSNADLEWRYRDHALFVAYVPVVRPRYAVAVIVEHGASGGSTAAPIARDIVEALLERDPQARTGYPAREFDSALPANGREG